MYESIIEIDLHGKNRHQAQVAIDAALRRSGPFACRIRLIHGFHSGSALREFIWSRYGAHPKVLRLCEGGNPGVTELVLREY